MMADLSLCAALLQCLMLEPSDYITPLEAVTTCIAEPEAVCQFPPPRIGRRKCSPSRADFLVGRCNEVVNPQWRLVGDVWRSNVRDDCESYGDSDYNMPVMFSNVGGFFSGGGSSGGGGSGGGFAGFHRPADTYHYSNYSYEFFFEKNVTKIFNGDGPQVTTTTHTPSAVPLPGAAWMFLSALAGALCLSRRFRKKSAQHEGAGA